MAAKGSLVLAWGETNAHDNAYHGWSRTASWPRPGCVPSWLWPLGFETSWPSPPWRSWPTSVPDPAGARVLAANEHCISTAA